MTELQRQAHERLLATLPARTVVDDDEESEETEKPERYEESVEVRSWRRPRSALWREVGRRLSREEYAVLRTLKSRGAL